VLLQGREVAGIRGCREFALFSLAAYRLGKGSRGGDCPVTIDL
jgi:hypothetical protein